MRSRQHHRIQICRSFLAGLLALVFVSGCGGSTTPTLALPTETQAPPAVTSTPAPTQTPSATPVPMALQVNEEGVSLAAFEADLRLLQAAHQALGQTVAAAEERQQVVDQWVDTLLLAQAARAGGFAVEDAALQAEVDRLAAQLGGGQNLADWMAERGYSDASFRETLRLQMAAAWQRDQIIAQVPTSAEQVRARQILTLDEETANVALSQVKTAGVNFAAQAYLYDPATGGDLGWFPRGYLTQLEVEEAAFALQPGEISPVIQSSIGYHIVQVVSREPSKALSPDALRALQRKAVADWLAAQRAGTQVDLLLNE